MSLTYLVVEPDQPLFRIPLKVMEALPAHRAALHDYAGKQIRVVEVRTIDDATGVPETIRNILGFYLKFDDNGLLREDPDEEWIGTGLHKMSLESTSDEKVVPFEHRAKQRDAEGKNGWKPTQEEMAAIVEAALGPPRAIKNVKHKKIKKLPEPDISYDTRSAFEDIREAISKIHIATFQLGEGELLGLHQMIEQRLDKIDHPDIWRGVIADNSKALKVLAAKRLGSGEWVAVVEIMKWNETESEANSKSSLRWCEATDDRPRFGNCAEHEPGSASC